MTVEKAIEVLKMVLATKTKKNEVIVYDMLQFSIACTVLTQNLTEKQLKKLLN